MQQESTGGRRRGKNGFKVAKEVRGGAAEEGEGRKQGRGAGVDGEPRGGSGGLTCGASAMADSVRTLSRRWVRAAGGLVHAT